MHGLERIRGINMIKQTGRSEKHSYRGTDVRVCMNRYGPSTFKTEANLGNFVLKRRKV